MKVQIISEKESHGENFVEIAKEFGEYGEECLSLRKNGEIISVHWVGSDIEPFVSAMIDEMNCASKIIFTRIDHEDDRGWAEKL